MFIQAETIAVCKECGEDIWPGDQVLVTTDRYVEHDGPHFIRVIYCKDCGQLYIESQELGQEDA